MKGNRSPGVPSLPDQNPGRLPAASTQLRLQQTQERSTRPRGAEPFSGLLVGDESTGGGRGAGTSGRPQL